MTFDSVGKTWAREYQQIPLENSKDRDWCCQRPSEGGSGRVTRRTEKEFAARVCLIPSVDNQVETEAEKLENAKEYDHSDEEDEEEGEEKKGQKIKRHVQISSSSPAVAGGRA